MNLVVDIIKNGGKRQSERFVRQKLYSSIVASCLSARSPQGQAEEIANTVCDCVCDWLQNKSEITSQDIRIIAFKHLKIRHPEAAYLYKQHRITI